MSTKVTMQDIANRLNISKSLVSLALADKYGVSDSMKTKIRLAAVEMGYEIPHPKKRKNQDDTNNTISILMTRHTFNDFAFYQEILNGIEQTMYEKQILLSLVLVDENDSEIINTRNIRSDGVIVLGYVSEENYAAIMSLGKAVVLLDTFSPLYHVDRISSNNFCGSYNATDYVIRAGHRHICFVGDPEYAFSFADRYQGFLARVRESSSTVRISEVMGASEGVDIPFLVNSLREILFQEDRPTALVCANDVVAEITYNLLREQNLSIPKDISVIGFDDNANSKTLEPPLTTMKVPRFAMGKLAVEQVWKQLNEKNRNQKHNVEFIQLDVELVERKSIAKIGKSSKR